MHVVSKRGEQSDPERSFFGRGRIRALSGKTFAGYYAAPGMGGRTRSVRLLAVSQ